MPNHVGVEREEKADKLAEKWSKLEQTAEHHMTPQKNHKQAPGGGGTQKRGLDDNLS